MKSKALAEDAAASGDPTPADQPAPAEPAAWPSHDPGGAMRLVEARLAAIIECSDDAIVAKTLDGIVTSWNAGAERIFGFTADEAIGQSILMLIPDDRRSEEAEVLARLRRGERIDHFETVRRAKDGRLLDISLTVSPIRDAAGRIVGASKIARDITERKRLEAERQGWLEREQRARHQAEREVQAKDEFLATVSHELRSPLNAILGWAHLLRAGGLDAERSERAVETIIRNAGAQSQLISDILDMHSLTSGRIRLNLQDVDLALTIEATLDSLRPAADAKGITLTPSLSAGRSVVRGDSGRIQQVIWNLLSNAVKFTPAGGRIDVRLGSTAAYTEISVEDTGPGVRPEFLPYVFQRFRQDTSSGAKQGGLGLGLAIVRHLVELHGGSVSARNRDDGSGAIFAVRFPCAAQAGVGAIGSGKAAEGESVAPRPSLRDLRVLIVDDEPDAREVITAVLALYGADATTAASVEEALSLLGRVRPHVIVSDLNMPDQDGYALIRAVRALPASEGGLTLAVALTAAGATEDCVRALRAGFQFHIPKPVEPLELARAIASLMAAGRT